MLIDTHSHLGLLPHTDGLEAQLSRARQAGVECGIITTGGVADFDRARDLAHAMGWGYAVGIHPLSIHTVKPEDLEALEAFLSKNHRDDHLVAMGEMGLDRFMDDSQNERQEALFKAQLQLAARYDLPVSVHSRRALFRVTALLKEVPDVKAALHAFAGSLDEARALSRLGYKMGFGGAMTYMGSKRVRAAAKALPLEALLLETDTPDMPPAFNAQGASEPAYLRDYLQELSGLRGLEPQALEASIQANTFSLFPKLQKLCA